MIRDRETGTVKRYIVRLSDAERERLSALINAGQHPARKLLKARILLKADISEAGEGWSDSRIMKALDTSPDTVLPDASAAGGGGIGGSIGL